MRLGELMMKRVQIKSKYTTDTLRLHGLEQIIPIQERLVRWKLDGDGVLERLVLLGMRLEKHDGFTDCRFLTSTAHSPVNTRRDPHMREVRITDGDTIVILDPAKVQHEFRLQGIDAPGGIRPTARNPWNICPIWSPG